MRGLYPKYQILKTNGEPVDLNADYFVLRLDTDPDARVAAFLYALLVRKSKPKLSRDLLGRISHHQSQDPGVLGEE